MNQNEHCWKIKLDWHCVCACLIYEWFGMIRDLLLFDLIFTDVLCDARAQICWEVFFYLCPFSQSLWLATSSYRFYCHCRNCNHIKVYHVTECNREYEIEYWSPDKKKTIAWNVFPLRFSTKLKKIHTQRQSNSNRVWSTIFHSILLWTFVL